MAPDSTDLLMLGPRPIDSAGEPRVVEVRGSRHDVAVPRGRSVLPQVRRTTMLVVVLVLSAGGIAAGSRCRSSAQEQPNGPCRTSLAGIATHRNQRCQEPQAETIEASWQQRERVYRVSFWVASLGAMTVLVLRLRSWQNARMSRFAANRESLQLGLSSVWDAASRPIPGSPLLRTGRGGPTGEGELVPHCPSCSRQRFDPRTTMMDDLLPSASDPLRQKDRDPGDVQEMKLRLLDVPSEATGERLARSGCLASPVVGLPHWRVTSILHARTQESARLTPGLCQRDTVGRGRPVMSGAARF